MAHLGKRQRRIARLFGGGAWDVAVGEIQQGLEEEGDNSYLRWQLGYCRYKQGALDEARGECLRCLELDPCDFEALRLLATIAFLKEDNKQAAEYVRKALAHKPEPMPGLPAVIARAFRILDLFPKWRGKGRSVERFVRNPNHEHEAWYVWAEEYLEWYRLHYRPEQSS